jgi:hypothetical protein
MINLMYNQKTPGKVDNLTLDVTISEQPTYANDVTAFPIEDGSSISDGVVQQPIRLVLVGLVTNSPLWNGFGSPINSYADSFRSSAAGQVLTNTGTRCDDAMRALLRMAGRVAPAGPGMRQVVKSVKIKAITVVTGLRVYNDMVVTSLVFDRDAATGDALPFTLTLVETTKVSFSVTSLAFPKDAATTPKLSSQTDVGKTTPAAAKPKTSALAGMYNRLSKGL